MTSEQNNTQEPANSQNSSAKINFHVSLFLGLIPLVGLCVELPWLIINYLKKNDSPEHKKWTRRLLGLFSLDIVLFVLLILFAVFSETGLMTQSVYRSKPAEPVKTNRVSPKPPRAIMGVALDARDRNPGVVILKVSPGAPAEEAGLRSRDRIIKINTILIKDFPHLLSELDRFNPGETITVTAKRGIRTVRKKVVLVSGKSLLRNKPLSKRKLEDDPLNSWAGVILLLLLIAFAALISIKKNRAALSVFIWSLLIFITAVLCSIGFQLEGKKIFSLEDPVYSMIEISILHVVLLSFSILAMYLVKKRHPEIFSREKTLSFFPALGLGFMYTYTILIRFSWIIYIIEQIFGLQNLTAEIISQVASTSLIHIAMVAVVGPIAEELFFRGLLLPGLLSRMNPKTAIAVSALAFAFVHLPYGYYVPTQFWMGIVFAWAYYKTGKLAVPIALHIFHNSLFLLRYLF
ncbi:MAG: CPBP family intramembrane metalloprotease [bacterium]|nr:CPBP family intramembrane metalloprotease [bacterium]